MQVDKERTVVFRQVLYAAADKGEVVACVGVRRLEFEGAFVADNSHSGLAVAKICVAEIVIYVGRHSVGVDCLLVERYGSAVVFLVICRVCLLCR